MNLDPKAAGPMLAPASMCGSAVGPLVPALQVLLVDDMAMNREIVASFLRAAGHRTTCARSGLEAVAAVAVTDFDIVLMDVRMPTVDGLEATRRIRALEGPRGQVPIVALTAQTFSEQLADCRKAGMDDYLAKSFDLTTLLATVVRAAAARSARGESTNHMSVLSVATDGPR